MDDMYGDFPTLGQIKRDYNELISIIGNVTTIEQLKKISTLFTIQINGEDVASFSTFSDDEIEWIRYEEYGCLGYIYVYIEDGKIDTIQFDVWSNGMGEYFMEDITIDYIENYKPSDDDFSDFLGLNSIS